jgi:hypothetical protein
MQHDDRATIGIERSQDVVDKIARRHADRCVGDRGMVDRGELDLDRTSTSTPREIETRVDGESVEPAVERLGVSKPREIAPGSDQPVLDRVACELGVPEDEAGRTVQPHDSPAGKLGEGVMIALPRSLDEPSLVHGRLGCGATIRSRSQPRASPWRERFLAARGYCARRCQSGGESTPTLIVRLDPSVTFNRSG